MGKTKTIIILITLFLALPFLIPAIAEEYIPNPDTSMLWYCRPAKIWSEAMPLGNGRLGAMVFGGPAKERILLNEETVWTGGPYNPTNPKGAKALPEIRQLIFDGDYAKAHKLFGRNMMGTPVEQMKYQPLGNLWLTFPGHEKATDYKRDLNMDTAIAGVTYKVDDVRFIREVFVSPVDQVIVIHLKANQQGQISFTAQLSGYRNTAHSNYGSEFYRMDGIEPDSLQLYGRTSTFLGVEGKVKFFARAKVIADGGEIDVDYDSLTVTRADSVTILIPVATNYVNYNNVSGNAEKRVMEVLEKVAQKSYDKIRKEHIAAHQELYRRVDIDLGSNDASSKPTDERFKNFAEGGSDPQLAALYFQFGRYLLISSSRPGTKPANLQGIWNEEMNPSWDSKYTTNINLEMNYWPVEVVNLAECAEPLIEMMIEITKPGAYTARKSYGARGWVLHQNTDIWLATAPMDGPSWGTFSTGGAWLCTHLWERYLYNQDMDYLKKIYPVLKGSALFFVDTLVEHPKYKVLVTCPATSPENVPHRPGNKSIHDEIIGGNITPNICAGPTMDLQILNDLFSYVIKASEILGRDKNLRTQLIQMRSNLAPMKIGQYGQLQEWINDWDNPKDTHRHFSHLYGMYPSCQINVRKTPKLAQAVKKSLMMRGDFGTGFSMAWKMNIWARLLDGDHAHKIFRNLIEKNTCVNLFSKCFRTPQVDGTFGACAGIVEMIMQSFDGEIHLLPAIPQAWLKGRIKGLRARGGFVVDIEWSDGKIAKAAILSELGSKCRLRTAAPVKIKSNGRSVLTSRPEPNVIEFQTQPGRTYIISAE